MTENPTPAAVKASAIPLPWPHASTDLEVSEQVIAELADRVSSQLEHSENLTELSTAKEVDVENSSSGIQSSVEILEINSCEIISPSNSCQNVLVGNEQVASAGCKSANVFLNALISSILPDLSEPVTISSSKAQMNGSFVAEAGTSSYDAQFCLHNSKPSTSKASTTPKISPKKKVKIPMDKKIAEAEQVKFKCIKEIKRLENAELPEGDEVRVLERIDKLRRKVFQIEGNLSKFVFYEDAEYEEFEEIDNAVNVANKIVLMETDLEPLNYLLTNHVNSLTCGEDRRVGYRCVTVDDVESMLKIVRDGGDCPIYDIVVPKEKENYENFLLQIVEMTNMRCRGKMFTQFLEEDFVESRNASTIVSQQSEGVSNETAESIAESAPKAEGTEGCIELPAIEMKPSLADLKPSLTTRLMEMKSEGLLDETPDEEEPGEVIDLSGMNEVAEADEDDYEDDDIEILDSENKKNAEASDNDIQEIFPAGSEEKMDVGVVKEITEKDLAKPSVESVDESAVKTANNGKEAIKRQLPPLSQTITDEEIQEACTVKRAKINEDDKSDSAQNSSNRDAGKSGKDLDQNLPVPNDEIIEEVCQRKDDESLVKATSFPSTEAYDPEKPELERTAVVAKDNIERERTDDPVIDLNFEGFDDDEDEDGGERSGCSSPLSLILKDTTEIEMIDLSDDEDDIAMPSNSSPKAESLSANSTSPEIINIDSEDDGDNRVCLAKNNNNNSINGGAGNANKVEDDDDDIEILYEVTK